MKAAPPVQVERASSFGVLQRKCACGGTTDTEGPCEECGTYGTSLQRKATGGAAQVGIPPIVQDVLRSPGQPLDAATRSFMEPRFGHDFSKVRVHADGPAAESARGVNALAYTVGRDVVFDSGQYAPSTREGTRLLAHELAHVVQQSRGVSVPKAEHESEAASAGDAIAGGGQTEITGATSVAVQRDAGPGATAEGNATDDNPRSLIEDLNVAALSPAEIQTERGKVTRWLQANSQSNSAERDFLRLEQLPKLDRALTEKTGVPVLHAYIEPYTAKHPIQELQIPQDPLKINPLFVPPAPRVAPAPIKPTPLPFTGQWNQEFTRGLVTGLPDGQTLQASWNRLTTELGPLPKKLEFVKGIQMGVASGALSSVHDLINLPRDLVNLLLEFNQHLGGLDAALQFLGLPPADLGLLAGQFAAKWLTEDFMNKSTHEKGLVIGQPLGYLITEVALLFLGPEELIIKSVSSVAKLAKAGKLGKAVLAILEKLPGFQKLLRARRAATSATEDLAAAAEIGEVLESTRLPKAGDVKTGTTPGLETGRAAPVTVSPEPLEGLESTRLADPGRVTGRKPHGFETGRPKPGRGNVSPGSPEGLEFTDQTRKPVAPKTLFHRRAEESAIGVLKREGGASFDLNVVKKSFPLVDVTSPREIASVKAFAGRTPIKDYAVELQKLCGGRGSNEIVNTVEEISNAQKAGHNIPLPPEYAADPAKYIREKATLRIPDDQVAQLREFVVNDLVKPENPFAWQTYGLPGHPSVQEATAFANRRIQGIGTTYADLFKP